jgi:hypothetical protein
MPTVSLPRSARPRRVRLGIASSPLETALVRASVGALRDSRHACRHCHRTPLVGERVHLYESSRRGPDIVCELCRPLRTAQPDRTVVVRSAEQRATVRALPARP